MNESRTRRLTYPLIAAALLAGCASARPVSTVPDRAAALPAASGFSPTPAPSRPPCPATGVLLRPGAVDAAMGLRALGLYLDNCGSTPFRVNGYPQLRVLDEQQAVLPVRVLQGVSDITISIPDGDGPPRPIVLEPGEQARAIVAWRNTYNDGTNPPVNAPYLDVAPAAGQPAQVLAPQGGLDLGSTGRVGVSPWLKSPRPMPPEEESRTDRPERETPATRDTSSRPQDESPL